MVDYVSEWNGIGMTDAKDRIASMADDGVIDSRESSRLTQARESLHGRRILPP